MRWDHSQWSRHGRDMVREYDSDYRYADAINRRARWGVMVVILLLFGVAWAGGANQDQDPQPSVLGSPLIVRSTLPITISGSSTTTVPPAVTTTSSFLDTVPTATTTTTTTSVPVTTTTRPRTTTTVLSTTTTTATTTTTTTTTTTVPPTTTTTVPATTTTTTVPPTTTTTLITRGTIHIHDLKGDAKRNDDGNYAKIEVHIRNDDGLDQRGVLVTARFSNAAVGAVAGTTNNKGKVIFESGPIDADSVTFTVVNLIHPDYRYAPDDNLRGPSITVEFG